jgi:fumarylacetoacetase
LNDGTERKFIQDGDTVIMRGYCEKDGFRLGFGEVSTKVLPAL